MLDTNYFEDLWAIDWGVGIFFYPPKIFPSYFIATGFIDYPYFNFASPLTTNFSEFNLEEVEAEFKKLNKTPAVYLTERHICSGFLEPLIRVGYKVKEYESWLGLESDKYNKKDIKSNITQITQEKYLDFSAVADTVFSDFGTQKAYSQICQETLIGTKSHAGVTSEFFVIYSDQQPTATGAMFWSIDQNFAYLHSDSTLEKYRGKGYQSDLIHYRTQRALELGINRIYAITEPGKTSWANYIKSGFNQIQTLLLLEK